MGSPRSAGMYRSKGCFEWKLGGIGSLSFGVCLNEGQEMLHWKHRESVTAQLPGTTQKI